MDEVFAFTFLFCHCEWNKSKADMLTSETIYKIKMNYIIKYKPFECLNQNYIKYST